MRIHGALKLHQLSGHQIVVGLDIVNAEGLHRVKKRSEGSVLLDVEKLAAKTKLVVAPHVVQILVDLKLIAWTISRDGAAWVEWQISWKCDVDRGPVDVHRKISFYVRRGPWLITKRIAGVDAVEGKLRSPRDLEKLHKDKEVLIVGGCAGIKPSYGLLAPVPRRDVLAKRSGRSRLVSNSNRRG